MRSLADCPPTLPTIPAPLLGWYYDGHGRRHELRGRGTVAEARRELMKRLGEVGEDYAAGEAIGRNA